MPFYKQRFELIKIFFFLFVSIMASQTGCGNNTNNDTALPAMSNDVGEQSSYPIQSYPADNVEAYPAPPSTDPIIQAPPEILPKFPGRIAFQTERFNSSLQLAILDGATGEVTQLNQMFSQSFEPSWSPDCSSLIFTVDRGDGADFELHQQDVESSATSLFISHAEFYDWGAAWSPSGDVVAYQTNEDALINVCFADPAGNELGCMERGGFSNAMPAWSSDGSQLVFSSNRDGNWELYITNYPAMDSLNRLTENTFTDFDPVFSPDGRTILFSSQREAYYNLFSIQADGQNERQLTNDGADERFPIWVGNDLIAYTSGFEEELELYLMNVDGSNPQRLTYSQGKDEWPSWCAIP
jgi:Tol biopolymer transport system component